MREILNRIVLIVLLSLFFTSCDLVPWFDDDGDEYEVPQRSVSTRIQLPENSSLTDEELQVISPLDSKKVKSDSTVRLNSVMGGEATNNYC